MKSKPAMVEEIELIWKSNQEFENLEELFLNGSMVAWLHKRPNYCDRGHWQVNASIHDLDAADSFPRYYMKHDVAVAETEAFIKWRLFKIRGE